MAVRERRIRFRQIRTFLEVARQRSVSRAAERLNTAQPAVSRSLRELEIEIGRPLFDRTSDGLVLTKAGAKLYHFADMGVAHLSTGFAEASGEGQAEVVTLGALPNITRRVLPEVVMAFKQIHPEVVVRLLTGTNMDLLRRLRTGDLDFVIGRLADPETMTGLSFEHMLYEIMAFAARPGHPLARKESVTLPEINQYLVIIPQSETVIRSELDKFMIAQGLPRFADTIETTSFEFAKPLLLSTDAIVALPLGAMEPELGNGVLCKLAAPTEALRGPVGISFLPGRQLSPPAMFLLNMLRERVAKLNPPALS